MPCMARAAQFDFAVSHGLLSVQSLSKCYFHDKLCQSNKLIMHKVYQKQRNYGISQLPSWIINVELLHCGVYEEKRALETTRIFEEISKLHLRFFIQRYLY